MIPIVNVLIVKGILKKKGAEIFKEKLQSSDGVAAEKDITNQPDLRFNLFSKYENQVFRFLAQKTSVDDAKDLLSQIRLSFIEKYGSLRRNDQLKNYIFQLTRDELKRFWLRKSRLASTSDFDQEDQNLNQEQGILRMEKADILRACLRQIPSEKVRNVALLRYGEGARHAAIRDRLSFSVDQVKKYIRKAEIFITDCVRLAMRQTN